MITIYFDAACKGNPNGDIGLGWTINNTEYCKHFGTGTNNVGEYEALIHSLECLHQNYDIYDTIQIYGDSKLVVEQVNNRWKVKSPHLLPLRNKAQSLLKGLSYTLSWIPREQNTIADRLSNEAYAQKPNTCTANKPNKLSKLFELFLEIDMDKEDKMIIFDILGKYMIKS